jgi:dTDP-4-dehydrorhamnose reductase
MKHQRIFLIAPSGMLGTAFVKHFEKHGPAYIALDHPDFDITDKHAVDTRIENADLIINCAAWTDVDGAETNEAAATKVNGEGVANLAARAKALNATLIHFSTDYVFNGQATTPYPVDAPLDPINAYGRSKAAGEKALNASGCRHLLIRTSWLYAPWGKNFVLTIAKLAREKEKLRVVNDQRGRPTSAEHLAATSLALYEKGAEGTYHVTDGGECTWYDLAKLIAAHVNPNCTIEPCTTAEFPRPAKRPTYSVLDLNTTLARVAPMPSWRDDVVGVLAR